MTEPPPSVEYSGQCTQWEMFDSYMEDIERRKEAEAKKGKKKEGSNQKEEGGGGSNKDENGRDNIVHSAAMAHAAKILERMANQNTFADVHRHLALHCSAAVAIRPPRCLQMPREQPRRLKTPPSLLGAGDRGFQVLGGRL